MIADIGFGILTAGLLVLVLLLLTVKSHTRIKYCLAFALVCSGAWSLHSISVVNPTPGFHQSLSFDLLKQFAWIIFLSAALHQQSSSLRSLLMQKSTLMPLAIPCLLMVSLLTVPLPSSWLYLGYTVVALTILLQLELLYRQAGDKRWAFKPLVIYLGTVNVLEFVTYANASMVNYLDIHFIAAKGYVYALFLPLMLVAMRRMEHWGIKIFISREIVLHSTLLIVAGAYLFLMAIAGYVIKYVGGEWGATVQIVLVVIALFLLVTILASTHIRQQIKVFITKNFFANQFDYREQWIALTNTLEVGEKALPDVYRTALKGLLNSIEYQQGVLCRIPKSNHDDMRIVAQTEAVNLQALDWAVIKAAQVYCREKPWIIDLNELTVRPEMYPNLPISPEHAKQTQIQFILPIYHENTLWGLACLYQQTGIVRELNWELRDYLNAILAQVANFILHHEASHLVAENAQFAAFSRMSAFVVHDLKNVLAQIDLILCNAQQHKNNPEFIDDTFETLEHTQARMQKMLKQLTEKHTEKNTETASHTHKCDLSSILSHVVEKQCATQLPKPAVVIDTECYPACESDKLQNVLYHLISNAQQATAEDGSVTVEVFAAPDAQVGIAISDTGSGMTAEFIATRLFKPFDTTKGNAGMGIGAYDARHYIEEVGGRLDVVSQVGQGSTFTIYLPPYRADMEVNQQNKEVTI
jgi:putative PEP-CTERM system histidine kinase